MGFGFGQGADMQKAYRSNRQMVAKRRSLKEITAQYHEKHEVLEDPKLTPAQFERFRTELEEKRRRERLKRGLFLAVLTISVTSVFILLLR